MFTGIITDIGEVLTLETRGDLRVRIGTRHDAATIDLGASIACDGVCLTVVDRGSAENMRHWFDVDISAESVSATTIGHWTQGQTINLERALRVGDELGGHIVSGHVDGVAHITSITAEGDSRRFRFRAPQSLARFIAPKGSVALNGTSLTVNDVNGAEFGINIIPHTLGHTTWGRMEDGMPVNLEVDTMARYVARLQETAA